MGLSVSLGALHHGGRAETPCQGCGASHPGVPSWVQLEWVAGPCILADPNVKEAGRTGPCAGDGHCKVALQGWSPMEQFLKGLLDNHGKFFLEETAEWHFFFYTTQTIAKQVTKMLVLALTASTILLIVYICVWKCS